MPSVITLAFLSFVCLTTNGQDFCQSYQRNGSRIVIFEEELRRFIFLVIDKHFWIVRNDFKSPTLFDPFDKKAMNPREQFIEDPERGNYSSAFIVWFEDLSSVYVFHKVLKIKFSS